MPPRAENLSLRAEIENISASPYNSNLPYDEKILDTPLCNHIYLIHVMYYKLYN